MISGKVKEIGIAAARYTISFFTPTWESVEGFLIYKIYGDEKTYFNTPSEIVCLIGLIANAVLMLLNFSLVYTGPSLMNACIVGSSVLGLYACRRMRHLIARQKTLLKKLEARDNVAKQLLPEAKSLQKNTEILVKEFDHREETDSKKLELLSEKVNHFITVARENQESSQEIQDLISLIQKWLEVVERDEAKHQEALADFTRSRGIEHQEAQLPDNTLSQIIAELRDLMPLTTGNARQAIREVGLKLIAANQANGDKVDTIQTSIQRLEKEVLPLVQGDIQAQCKEIIDKLKNI